MSVSATVVNHAKRVPHPDPKLAKQKVTVPAVVSPSWQPIRRLVMRAFRAEEDMEIPNDLHGMQTVDAGDFVVQDERGHAHRMTAEDFERQFVFVADGAPFGGEAPTPQPRRPQAQPVETPAT